MRALIHPAVSSLARQVDKDEFNAVRYVLDWAGFKATEKIEQDGTTTITVEYVGRAPVQSRRVPRSLNGHADDPPPGPASGPG